MTSNDNFITVEMFNNSIQEIKLEREAGDIFVVEFNVVSEGLK